MIQSGKENNLNFRFERNNVLLACILCKHNRDSDLSRDKFGVFYLTLFIMVFISNLVIYAINTRPKKCTRVAASDL